MSTVLHNLVNQPYKHGFVTEIESDVAPKGLNEDTIRLISIKKNEPQWLLDFRLEAYRHWLEMDEPTWPNVRYPKIDFQAISYYSAPKAKPKLNSMDEVDPEHPYAYALRYAEAIPGAQLVSEEEGASPLAWQGAQVSKVISGVAERAAAAP